MVKSESRPDTPMPGPTLRNARLAANHKKNTGDVSERSDFQSFVSSAHNGHTSGTM